MDPHTFLARLFELQHQAVPRLPVQPDFEDTTVTVYPRSPSEEREPAWLGEMQEA